MVQTAQDKSGSDGVSIRHDDAYPQNYALRCLNDDMQDLSQDAAGRGRSLKSYDVYA